MHNSIGFDESGRLYLRNAWGRFDLAGSNNSSHGGMFTWISVVSLVFVYLTLTIPSLPQAVVIV